MRYDRMFLPMNTLEAWMDSQMVELAGSVVRLPGADIVYTLEPAVRFLESETESDEATGLKGKVLKTERVEELGGELVADSVLFGEAVFRVESGFIAALQSRDRLIE
jgi:hypothetical protein